MPHIGPGELVIILLLALIIFGPGKLPQVGRAIGESIREFKASLSGGSRSEGQDHKG